MEHQATETATKNQEANYPRNTQNTRNLDAEAELGQRQF